MKKFMRQKLSVFGWSGVACSLLGRFKRKKKKKKKKREVEREREKFLSHVLSFLTV